MSMLYACRRAAGAFAIEAARLAVEVERREQIAKAVGAAKVEGVDLR